MLALRQLPLALLSVALLTPAASATEVHFSRHPDPPGTTRTSLFQTTIDLSISGAIGGVVIVETGQQKVEVEHTDETLLAREEGFRKSTISYPTCRTVDVQSSPDGTFREAVPCPVEGKTYTVLWTSGEGYQVTDAAGRPVGEEESARVLKDQGDDDDSFGTLVSGKTMALGDTLDIPADEIQDLLGIAEEVTLDSFVIRLTETRKVAGKEVAVFNVELKITMTDEMMTMVMHMAGELLIDPETSEEVSLDLRGPATIAADAPMSETVSMQLEGSGSLRIEGRILKGATPPAE